MLISLEPASAGIRDSSCNRRILFIVAIQLDTFSCNLQGTTWRSSKLICAHHIMYDTPQSNTHRDSARSECVCVCMHVCVWVWMWVCGCAHICVCTSGLGSTPFNQFQFLSIQFNKFQFNYFFSINFFQVQFRFQLKSFNSNSNPIQFKLRINSMGVFQRNAWDNSNM